VIVRIVFKKINSIQFNRSDLIGDIPIRSLDLAWVSAWFDYSNYYRHSFQQDDRWARDDPGEGVLYQGMAWWQGG
jgi:hypothetical protein